MVLGEESHVSILYVNAKSVQMFILSANGNTSRSVEILTKIYCKNCRIML